MTGCWVWAWVVAGCADMDQLTRQAAGRSQLQTGLADCVLLSLLLLPVSHPRCLRVWLASGPARPSSM